MDPEQLPLLASSLMLGLDAVLLSRPVPRDRRGAGLSFYLAFVACASLILVYGEFVLAFFLNDFSIRAVFQYSSSNMSGLSKLAATWSGGSGSMLLLASMVGAVYLAYRVRTRGKSDRFHAVAYVVFDFALLLFLIPLTVSNPFSRNASVPQGGLGLNPLLQNLWMEIHPPIIFASYALVLLALALVLGGMASGRRPEDRLLRLSTRSAWLLLTIGIAVGAVWAYAVLGWGGYWAWDPIQTASLLPWLSLTAYFHLGPLTKRPTLARELMVLVTFLSMIFASILARGGSAAASVHAYAASPVAPVVFLAFAAALAAYFFHLARRNKEPLFSPSIDALATRSPWLLVGFVSLVSMLVLAFSGVLYQSTAGTLLGHAVLVGPDYYNNALFPFVMAFVAALIGYSAPDGARVRTLLAILGGAVSLGAVLLLFGWPTSNRLANLALPLLVLGLAVLLGRFVRVVGSRERTLGETGRSLLHLAIVLILIGVLFSSAGKQSIELPNAVPNSTLVSLGLRIDLGEPSVLRSDTTVPLGNRSYPEFVVLRVNASIAWDGSVHEGALWTRLYAYHGLVSTPSVFTTWRGDLYVFVQPTQALYLLLLQDFLGAQALPTNVTLTVEIVPAIYLVWGGVALLVLGMSLPLVAESVERDLKRGPKPTAGGWPPKARRALSGPEERLSSGRLRTKFPRSTRTVYTERSEST